MTSQHILDTLKLCSSHTTMTKDSLELSMLLKAMSSAMRTNNKAQVQSHIIELIEYNLTIAKLHDINMKQAWRKWASKARAKTYYSD